jgi:hypothetical protein
MTTKKEACSSCGLIWENHLDLERTCHLVKAEWKRAEQWHTVAKGLAGEILEFMNSEFFARVMDNANEEEFTTVKTSFAGLIHLLTEG